MSEPVETLSPIPSEPSGPQASTIAVVKLSPEQIQPNPFSPRDPTLDEDEEETVVGLMGSIQHDELFQRPHVRQLPDGTYQLITGGLRVLAYRRLRDQAKTGEERQLYATIPVEVKTEVDDRKMASRPIAENAHRAELKPVKMARAIMALKETFGLSHDELKQETGLEEDRLRRLIRLDAVADFIKQSCIGSRRGKGGRQGLDVMAAIELDKAYSHLAKREKPKLAQRKVEALIRKAIAGEWPFHEIAKQARQLAGIRLKDAGGEEAGETAPANETAPASEATAAAEVAPATGPGDGPPQAGDGDGAPATAPLTRPAALSPLQAVLDAGEGPHNPYLNQPSTSDNPALEYVGGDPDAVCVHLDRLKQLTPPQRKELREIVEIILTLIDEQ